jgi:release factor glutamine methyltransferase
MTLTYAAGLKLPGGEVLLPFVLGVSRAALHTHPERIIPDLETGNFLKLSAQFADGAPLAYLTGQVEFWSLQLLVTQDTLIPRPETEILVESVLALPIPNGARIADLGTGSGAIGLALAQTLPYAKIYATDCSEAALAVAKKNAARLGLTNIAMYLGDWLQALPDFKFDIIVSNPPYVGEDDIDLDANVPKFEPHLALFAKNSGMQALTHLIKTSFTWLKKGGYLFVEHGSRQAAAVRQLFAEVGYTDIFTARDLAQFSRVTYGKVPIA